MSGQTYWASIVGLLALSTGFWWATLSWMGVTDPLPAVAVLDAIALTAYLVILRWILAESDPATDPK